MIAHPPLPRPAPPCRPQGFVCPPHPAPLQAKGKPYVIVFCGVNGVGKSTNLAKIAYWLGQHNIKVTIAACDTFRAGEGL